MTLLLYVLASFGLAFVIGYSKISFPLRAWLGRITSLYLADDDKIEAGASTGYSRSVRFLARWLLSLLECPACLAFWFGVAATFTPIADFIPFSTSPLPLTLFLGFANCGAVLVIGMITGLIKAE